MVVKQSLSNAFKNAFMGIMYCIRNERNMKIHMIAATLAVTLAWWFDLDSYEMMILLLTISSVFVTEMINTALEALVDIVSPEKRPLAKIAKDAAAGAVLITALSSLFVGYLLFFEKIWR